jgi:hypothetical protein
VHIVGSLARQEKRMALARWALFLTLISLPCFISTRHTIRHHSSDRSRSTPVHHDSTLPSPTFTHQIHAQKPHRISPQQHRKFHSYRSLISTSSTSSSSVITPLYIGYGTHISYIYVGNPNQRQSVIIDTGSVYTAFPCTGCKECGEHTDQYFEPKNSTTSIIPKCGLSTCSLAQSYSEGSSWKAYKVIDEVYVGGMSSEMIPTASEYKINMTFGCQTSETGLFRTQLADGIMGLARSPSTLPYLLHDQGVTSTKIFAICYNIGGGILTLGGVDQSLHQTNIVYTSLTTATSGWYGIWILEISLREQTQLQKKYPLDVNEKQLNSGSGIIVDSGTTDTYLPSMIQQEFMKIFQKITGLKYHNNGYELSDEQIRQMPDIIFTIKDESSSSPETSKTYDLVMPVTSYADIDSKGRYVFRVYLTEGSGGVLGSNFMNNYNIIFDPDGHRIGFAESTCNSNLLNPPPPLLPPSPPSVIITPPPLIEEGEGGGEGEGGEGEGNGNYSKCLLKPLNYCSAHCSRDEHDDHHSGKSYVSYGNQSYLNECTKQIERKECYEFCNNDNTIARGYKSNCLNTPWSECNLHCEQERTMVTTIRNIKTQGEESKCQKIKQRRDCFVDECPVTSDDFFILSDWKYKYPPALPPGHWEKIYEEDLFTALSQLLKV